MKTSRIHRRSYHLSFMLTGLLLTPCQVDTSLTISCLFSARLNNLVDSQPRRNKKSHRCLLHSLDSQRSRPITPAWRDVWDCMRPECKRDVCVIDAASLHTTLETYLRKHRFCGECRTKVLKGKSCSYSRTCCDVMRHADVSQKVTALS